MAAAGHVRFRSSLSSSRFSGWFFLTIFLNPGFIQSMYKAFLSLPVDEKLMLGHDLPEKYWLKESDWVVWVTFIPPVRAILSLGFNFDT